MVFVSDQKFLDTCLTHVPYQSYEKRNKEMLIRTKIIGIYTIPYRYTFSLHSKSDSCQTETRNDYDIVFLAYVQTILPSFLTLNFQINVSQVSHRIHIKKRNEKILIRSKVMATYTNPFRYQLGAFSTELSITRHRSLCPKF